MSTIVETQNATIDTLAVTIQSLHVSGKQMTLAVFRQLPRTSAYADTGELRRELERWGIVRYNIKDEGDVWLVASMDGCLYRCSVSSPFQSSQLITRYFNECALKLRLLALYEKSIDDYNAYSKLHQRAELECPFKADGDYHRRAIWINEMAGKAPPYPQRPGVLSDYAHGTKPEVIRMELEEEQSQYGEMLVRAIEAERSTEALLELTQLFIAV